MKRPQRSLLTSGCFDAPLVVIAFAVLLPGGLVAASRVTLEVSAGDADRRETVVRWELPADIDAGGDWRLVREDGRQVAAQVDSCGPPSVSWILEEPLGAGRERRYVLERQRSWAFANRITWADVGGTTLLYRVAGKDAFAYNYGAIRPPAGIESIFERSGYIHPLYSPGGLLLTNDSPAVHKHHHGIWVAWSQTVFEGRPTNFWEQARQEGKVEAVGVDAKMAGPVFGGFRARHRFVDLKTPGGPKPVLDETWDVRIYELGAAHAIDFVSTQRCAGARPLTLKRHLYGGFGFRGSAEWEGEESVSFLTSEGRTRENGNETTARWCQASGRIGGRPAAIGFLCHPEGFRAPQGMRIHPAEPFFSFAPCQAGEFELALGEELVLRYRIIVRDEPAGADELDRLWRDYADPPKVERVLDR